MYTLRIQLFQKRTPAQEQTNKELQEQPTWCISIHRLLAEPDRFFSARFLSCVISIHRLLAEPDCTGREFRVRFRNFNPQAPRGARRRWALSSGWRGSNFNPQAPRGARRKSFFAVSSPFTYFNPQAPRGARLWV